jgi:hypothetical protein
MFSARGYGRVADVLLGHDGYLAGVLNNTLCLKTRVRLYIRAVASFIFGMIMDTWFLIGFVDGIGLPSILATFAAGLPST